MKPWNENKKLFFVFVLILCFQNSIQDFCDSTLCTSNGITCSNVAGQTCPPNCKPKYGDTTNCYNCNGIVDYYTIDSNNNCLNQCLGDKIIGDSGQCIYENLPHSNFKKLGDVYYHDSGTTYSTLTNCPSNVCSCNNYYSIETLNGKKIYTCFNTLEDEELKGYKYYNYRTLELYLFGCPLEFNVQKTITLTSPAGSITRCYDKCIGSEFLIEIQNSGITNYYCVDSCGTSPYESYNLQYTDNDVKKCLTQCPDGTFIKNSVCVTLDQCDFYDPGTRICYSTCPDNEPDLRFHNSDSKECISQCPSVDYIYRSTSPTDYTCYKKEDCNFVKESVTPHTCLSSCEGSGEFHDYDSKLCTSSCGSEDTTKIYYAYNGHICYSSCSEIPGEYVYEREISGKRVCYKKANKPSDTDCQAFYQSANGILKCTTISDCITTLYKNYLIGDECRDSCNGYYQIELTISTNKVYIKCFATLDAALADGNVKFYDKTQKKCWETFPDVNSYFLKSYTNADTKFEVVRECPNYYNEFTDSTTVCNGCFQCITNCKTKSKFFVSGNKKCKGSCDLFNKYYYDDSNNECLDSCELRPNKPFSDKLTVASGQDLPSPVKCKDSCGTSKYYDYNSHICLSACESPNLYTKRTTDTDTSYKNICYPSCLDIPGGTYKYELSDNSCTNIEITSFPHNDAVTSKTYHFYYEKSYGIIKYAQASDCTNLNFIYIVGNECKRNCEDTYYKMTVTVSSTQFTKCFAQPSGCLGARASTSNKIYYNQNLKKCWEGNTGIPTTYFIKEISNDLYELVDECENYYYEQGVFKYCIEKCMSNQDTSKTYFINSNKKCLDQSECLTLQKYLYDPSNKECLDTCKERTTYNHQPLIQGTPTPTSLEPCQQSCSTDPYLYYSYNSNICIEKCGDDGSNNKYHAIDAKVCYPYCLNIPNGNYVYEKQATDGTFTCYDDKSAAVSAGCNYFIQQSNGIKKCTTAADCYNNNKIYILDNECKDNCENDYYKLDYKIDIDETSDQDLKPFIKCFQTIDDCFRDANVGVATGDPNPIYYNEKLKKCWKDFPNDYYIKNKDNSNKYELVEKCDDFYYVHTTTGENICTSNCKTLTDSLYFIKGNQQCLTKSQCFTNNQKYYDPENNECLNTCKGRPLYKFQHKIPASPPQTEVEACVENCNSGTNADVYYSYDSSECLNYCGEDGSINKYYPDNGKACYPSCLDIPGGNHIYEIKDTTTYTTALPTNHIIYKCYNTIPGNCDYYYISSDGTRKCTTITDCYNKGFTYIVGQECKDKCENDFYKLDYKIGITVGGSTVQKPFVICLQTIDDCKTYGTDSTTTDPLYYNEKLKKCWKTFPMDYYIKEKGNTPLDKYELVEKCDDYYYVNTGENICTSNCKTSNSLYFIKGNQKCMALTDCKTFSKYYYDPSTNECLDTCIGRDNLEFADYIDFEASSPAPAPTKCKSTCGSSQHYNFGTKICLDTTTCTTGKFIRYNSLNPKVCYGSCAEISSGDILYEKGTECYLKTEFSDFEANCPYYFKRDDNTIKCAATIPECQSAGYDYLDDTECKKDCGDFYKYLDTSSNNIIRCYQNYEIAHSKINAIEYYDKTYKELWSSYPPTMFILYDNNGASFEVVRVCDTYYYEKDTVNHINYCKDDCKSVNLFFLKDNKKCESSCNSFSKKYYNPTNNECLDTCSVLNDLKYSNPVNTDASSDSIPEACLQICPNYFITKLDGSNTIYECVENCPPDSASPYKLIDIKTKECLQSCKSDQNLFDVDNHKYCYPKCDVDNGFVYINTDNYSCVKTCPSYLQKWELLGNFGGRDVFLCKSSCNENEYRLEDKCLTQCPQNFNFIGYNKICKAESCALDPNGQHYYPINEYDEPSPSYLIYKCINSCSTATINSKNYFFYTEDDPYKCLETCPPLTHRFYLYSNQNECIKKCPENYPFYNDPSGIATPVLCKDRTDCNANQFFDSGNCIPECPTGKKYVSSDRRCLDKCPDNEIKKKSSTFDTDQTYNCLRSCEKFIYKENVEDEPECVDYCPDGNYVGKDNNCKISCDEEDGLFYYEIDFTGVTPSPPSSYKLYKCIDGCKGDYKYREVDNGNQCYKTCTANFPYLSSDERLCYDICLKSKDKPFTLDKQDSTGASLGKICSNECTNDGTNVNIYYGDNKVCIKDCAELEDAKITDHDNHCVANCDKSSSYLFQLNNKCVDKCEDDNPSAAVGDPLPKKRYSLGDYVCKEKCIENENIVINGRQCVSSCNNYISPLTTGEYECIPSCSNTDYPFFYPSDKKCLPHCKTGDKVVQDLNICVSNCGENYFLYKTSGASDVFKPYDMCVLRCPDNKPYIYNGECVEICPETTKKFFQSEFTHGETERHQICLTDCPVNYPYYTVRVVPGPPAKNYYECKSTCEGYYVPNEDSLIQAKLCVSTCTATDTYKFRIEKIIDNKLIKKCYPTCPTEAKYHFDTDTTPSINDDNKCYEECPEINPYHEKGSTKCKKLSQLSAGFILYDIKEWVSATGLSNCPSDYKLYSQTESPYNVIKICLKEECEFKDEAGSLYIYKTPYNTCVKDCSNSASSPLVNGKNLINDVTNKKCVCENLYYIHETSHEITCYAGSIGKVCKEMATATTPYPLPLNGTNQCLKSCNEDRILNPSENICYEKNTPCSEINSYTKLITTNGHKKCDCAYKYYFESTHVNKTCLAENSICTGQNNLYIPSTMECVNACPSTYSFKFRNFCLDHCPLGSTIGTTDCDCGNKFWYESYPGNYECLDGECLDEFTLYAPQNKQCLKTCIGGYYPILFENKCYDKCDSAATGVSNLEIVTVSSPLAKEKCECPRPWYYDASNNNVMHCPDLSENINRCEDYNKNINFMIPETKQCVKECPTDQPYYFNNKCYKSCEIAIEEYNILNIEAKESSYECVCQNLWYIDPQDTVYKKDKICYRKDINECPRTADITVPSTRYLINSTKECVNSRSECPTNSYKFNFICYDKCPEFTLEGKEPITSPDNTVIQDNICVCNTNGYLYLDYQKYGNKYYRCGLVTCPEIFINEEQEEVRKNLLESENKCVKNCTEDGKSDNEYIKSFRNTCVKKCPNKTETYYDECRFYELTDEDNIDDLNKLKEAANIQAKELYEESEQMSGYLLNKFDASLQIYALGRYNNNKDLIMKSNLTYIDLGTCLERIYEDGNLEDDDKILVTKYDLLTRNNKNNNDDDGNNDDGDEQPQESIDDKYLINQVEYEFFLESTMEKIEGSICNPYEIEISYPIFFNKNRFNNFAGGINANDYQNKFRIGKELHSKDAEIDTFNKDNKVYKDLCVGVELNGKDLVLEERYDYLYPNNVSICESNCTMKNTDFDLERINCMCTYKEIFDFNRVDEDTNDILNDPNFHKTTQSGANAEIIKCLSKISVKQGIVKNEAFYFSAVVTAVEISMAVVSAVYGVKAVAGFMKGMLGMGQGNSIVNFKKSNPAVTSTNRMLNNPPKKGEENTNEENDEDNKGNIVIKKNIKMNYNPNTINNNEISEIDINNNDNNSNINYGLSIKSGFPKNKKKINIENEINNKTKVNNKYNTVNLYSNKKAEFIPPQYNFKFFKPNDKGIVKKIERSKIPFDVDKDTKILLETKKDVIYDDNYLDGPFYEDQNVIEIIDDINTNKVIKFNESNNNINNNFDSSVIIKKNANRINNKNDISAKEEIPKSKKRRISNKINSEEKDFITIKKINPITSLQMTVEDYKEEEEIKNVDSTTSIYNLVKREHTYLRVTYERYIAKRHPNILATFLAEILDKIYFIKIFIFLKKFDIFSIHLALYMFYHILLLSLLCGFFTIKVIKKIWEDSNYPTMNFYLLYGFLGNVIIWIIYRIFILLLDNQDRFRALVKLHNESMNNNTSRANLDEDKEIKDNDNNKEVNLNQQDMINENYEELIKKIKIQTIVFYIIIILITAFCFIYLVSFFAIYTGTKGKVFKAYYISIIEIILIKFVYGLCLASLRIAGEGNELKSLYNFVYYCDKYVS